MKWTALVACLALPTIGQPLVRYRVTVDGGSVSAICYSFLKTSTTFVPPNLTGASGSGSLPSWLAMSLPSVWDSNGTFGYELMYTDGVSYLAAGLQSSWLSTYGTYEFSSGPLGKRAYFTTEQVRTDGVPEPAALVGMGFGLWSLRRCGHRYGSLPEGVQRRRVR